MTSSGSTHPGSVVTIFGMDDAYPSVLDEWCSHCGRPAHDQERADKPAAEAAALRERLLSSDDSAKLRRAISMAWGGGEFEDLTEAAALLSAVTRATRP